VTASCELQPCRKSNAQYVSFRPSTPTSRWLPVKWRHFWVTAGHLRSRDISCHVTASSCELQPCRKSNAHYMQVVGLLHPLSGDFRWNKVTSGSLPVTWGLVTSFSVTWLPPPTSYSLVGSQTHNIRQFSAFYSHFQVASGQMTTSAPLPVTWDHVTSFPVTWLPLPASQSLVGSQTTLYASFRPSTAYSRWLPVKWRQLWITSGHLRSRDVISCHVTWFPVTWLPPPASYSLVGNQTHSIRQFSAFYSHFQVTSGQITSLPGHLRLPEVGDVISCHVIADSCEEQPCRKSNAQYT